MPDLPQLPLVDRCPDCKVPVGSRHTAGCLTAVCLATGQQRVLHDGETFVAGHQVDDDGHHCGEDAWTGRAHGTIEAVAHGLFVRPATEADDPLTGWIPCDPGAPGAHPDLLRVARDGRWNPVRRVWEMPEAVTGRG